MVEPNYDERGLVPCIVQDATTGTVLMLAWMNAEALQRTLETREVTFWSRSRQALWKKGETSGHTLALVELRVDCDRDCLLALAHPAGPACHTGATSCFFSREDDSEDAGVPELASRILQRLDAVIAERRDASTPEKSYTRSLLDAGMPKILAKIAEEHGELAAELPGSDDGKTIHEAADLVFHVMVGLGARRIPIDAVLGELARRFGTSGHAEKASRKK
jgi:phosphoribosyl-AMP cyclohydrolase / phosphoribosyl-ATP pyrophosphohydrolase